MSVIVMGMEMPKSCRKCPFFVGDPDDLCYRMCRITETKVWCNIRVTRGSWCPLRPLPEKHGRLIDADAMERLMSDTVQGDIRGYPYSDTLWDTAFRWMDNQPTIVEAEGD